MAILKYIFPYLLFIIVFAIIANTIANAGSLPYNIRELFSGRSASVSGALISIVLALYVVMPVYICIWLNRVAFIKSILSYPVIIAFTGFLAWLMLWVAVPLESLHDIVGAPVLDWPWHWEILLRFIALQMPLLIISTGVVIVLLSTTKLLNIRPLLTAKWIFVSVPLLMISHWVVVRYASTDNLVELMENQGTWKSSIFLYLWVTVCVFNGYLSSIVFQQRTRAFMVFTLISIACSFPLGFGLLSLGLEDMVFKYGKTFSALEFLLGPDRDHTLSSIELIMRYSILHSAWLFVIFLLSLPLWFPMASTLNRKKFNS